jgi:hypothetical protein
MPIPIQTDPFSLVINSASLLVAIMQLCLMWTQRARHNKQDQYIDDSGKASNQVDQETPESEPCTF